MKTRSHNPQATRQLIVEAAIGLILQQGYHATTVDRICAVAGATKGSFFHHFPSKDHLGLAAMQAWGEMGQELYAPAWQPSQDTPLRRVHRLLDIMSGFAKRDGIPCRCVIGMMTQELAGNDPQFREESARQLAVWTELTAKLFGELKAAHDLGEDFDPEALATMLNSLWQGSMLVAKGQDNQEIIVRNLDLFRQWIDGFLGADRQPTLSNR